MTSVEADLLDTLRLIAAVASCPPDMVRLACQNCLFAPLAAKLLYVRKLCGDTLIQYGGDDGGEE